MPDTDSLVQKLKTLGLTNNESRIYLALLKQNPATGYEISRLTSVPRSAIYSLLGRLESLNIINGVGGRPRKYVPLAPEALVDHYAHKLEHNLAELRTGLAALTPTVGELDVWFIKGYENMILKAQELIWKAQNRIFLSLWATEFHALQSQIQDAIVRGVEVTLFSFTTLPDVDARLITYDLDEKKLRKAWKPTIILVTDDTHSIMGGAQRTAENQVVWTAHPSLTGLATNHIILDLTLAGQRLDCDVTSIVAPMMQTLKFDLGAMLDAAHPQFHTVG